MIFHENEKCPVCDKIFTSEDDIVFCPVCGTPHHRECYNSLGKCVNEDKHESGFEYKFEEKKQSNAATAAQKLNPNNIYYVPKDEKEVNYGEKNENVQNDNNDYDGVGKTVCSKCGNEIDKDTPFCPYCGSKQENPQYKPANPFNMGLGAESQVYKNSKDTIDGKKISDVASVVKVNTAKFIPKFIKNKKVSWNWGAFFFGPYYLLFRKMYKEGVIALVLRTAVSLFVQGIFAAQVSDLYSYFNQTMQSMRDPNYVPQQQSFVESFNEIFQKAPQFLITAFVCTLVINVIIALISNMLYRKKVISVLNKMDENLANGGMFSAAMPFAGEETSLSQEEMKQIYLSRMGGISFFAPVMAYFVLDLVSSFLSSIL